MQERTDMSLTQDNQKTISSEKIPILQESEDWIAVAKAPRLLVHSHPRFPDEYTLVERLRDQFGHPIYTVHRLDRQASGLMIFAKRPGAVAGGLREFHRPPGLHLFVTGGPFDVSVSQVREMIRSRPLR